MIRPVLALAALALPITSATAQQSLAAFMLGHGYSAVPLTKLRTGHDAVAVVLNGVATTFMLDSGASNTILNTGSLAKFGLKPKDRVNAGGGVGLGAGGVLMVGAYPIRALRIGDRDVPMTRIYAIDLGNFASAFKYSSSMEIDGIIGQDVLTRFGGVIDVANSRLYLKLPR